MESLTNLCNYFRDTVSAQSLTARIGMEVETSFVYKNGKPISVNHSQEILRHLQWKITATKGNLITELCAPDGSRILYELGRQNLELSLAPYHATQVVASCRKLLDMVYQAASKAGAEPYFGPILETDEDLLVVPDERDATWVQLDGRPALNLLARCSAVQFTVETSFRQAPLYLERLLKRLPEFLAVYPQEHNWRQYISLSNADYRQDRYGGPTAFESIDDYCRRLLQHDVVQGQKLVPHSQVENLDLNLFLRSVWWYFRLRRYENRLCLEVRPLPRNTDDALSDQLQHVLEVLSY